MLSRFRPFLALGLIALTSLVGAQTTKPGQIVKIEPLGTVEVDLGPSVDTRKFLPQINLVSGEKPKRVGNIFRFEAEHEVIPPNNLPVGTTSKTPVNPVLNALWPAIGPTGWTPPDPTLAVGPNHVVVTVNSSVAFYNRTGTQLFQQTLSNFFSGLWESNFIFDPKVFYDKISDRYFMVVLEQEDSRQISKLLLAVSDDNNPEGTWHRYRIDSKLNFNSTNYWLDYPGFGFNKDAIVISGNMFPFSSNSFGGVMLNVIPKAPLLSGSSATATRFHDTNAGSVQIAEIADNTVASVHGISRQNTGFAKWFTITNPATSPSLSTGFIAIPTYTNTSNAAVSRTTSIDASDGRLLNAAWRGNRILAAHTIRTSTDSTNRVRWYEFNFANSPTTAPTLVQSGDVAGPSGTHFFMPAINKNAAGDISVIFSRSSSTITADIMFAGRYSSDPAGQMGAPVNLLSSAGANYMGGFRWGDYFQVNVDPFDENRFWGIAMNARADGNWQTHVLDFVLSGALSTLTGPNSVTAGNGGTLTVTLSSAAAPGGQVVNLSSNSAALSVPSTVTVPAGSTSATVNFTTNSVNSNTNATVTATLNGNSRTKVVQVTPAGLTSVSLPTTIASGSTVTGTVTFAGTVPPAGITVALSSSDASLQVPSTVTIPSGSLSANFDVTTTTVNTPRDVTVTASHNGVTRTRTTQVRAPELVSAAVSLNTMVGGTTAKSVLTVTLDRVAPKGGITVDLSSSNAAIVVPATLRIVEGQTTKTLSLSSSAVAEDVTVTIGVSWQGVVRTRPIVVKTARPRGFSITPNVFIGGSSTVVKGKVTLDGPAVAGGKTVALSSFTPSALDAPPTVVVPAGAMTVEFDLTHYPVTVDRVVRIQATASGWSIWSGNATVRPPFSVTVAPDVFVGGSATSVVGTVRLNAISATPTVVTLVSSAPNVVSVPATITIPAGVASRTFTLNHVAVTSARTARITATIDGTSLRSNVFTINP